MGKHFQNEAFQKRWKFLFVKYRGDRYGWCLVLLLKGLLVNLGPIVLEDAPSQLYWMVFCCAAYFIVVFMMYPWRENAANIFDGITNLNLVIVFTLFAWFAERHSGQ